MPPDPPELDATVAAVGPVPPAAVLVPTEPLLAEAVAPPAAVLALPAPLVVDVPAELPDAPPLVCPVVEPEPVAAFVGVAVVPDCPLVVRFVDPSELSELSAPLELHPHAA